MRKFSSNITLNLLYACSLCLAFSSFVFNDKTDKANKPIVEIMLDSIPPGPITVKQLFAVKQIRIISAGENRKIIEHKIKSGVLQLWATRGMGNSANYFTKIDLKDNSIPLPLSYSFAGAQVGYTVSLGALCLEEVGTNYKCVAYPNWGVVAEKDVAKK